MSDARLVVGACGPLVSWQDGGRPGMLRFGVPASGPMDRLAHAAANVALGRPQGATAIEISMGGLAVRCESGDVTCCIAGGDFRVVHGAVVTSSWCVRTLRAGDTLSVRPGRWGSWAYLAFCGEPVCERWAGRTATHSLSGLGGGVLAAGGAIVLHDTSVEQEREGVLPVPAFAYARKPARVVPGPQTRCFEPDALSRLIEGGFSVTAACDRMGMRLSGPKLALADALSIPSEPIVRGSIQVGGDGVASILMADHQTTGGYPKIATVLSSDLDGLSQLRPLEGLSFQSVDPAEAIRLVRRDAALRRDYLQAVSLPRESLDQRLMSQNLISGFVSAVAVR